MTFGEKLFALRKEAGLSQEGLAEKLDVSRQAVSRWENEGILPDCPNLLALSRLFGVSTDYLLHDDYQSDGDLPAVRRTEDRLTGVRQRESTTILLAGLHAVILLLAMGTWAAWQHPLPVALCAAAALGDILYFEFWLRRSPAETAEARSLRRRYYRLSVWFFAWFPMRWGCVFLFHFWPRSISSIAIGAVVSGAWLLLCVATWWLLREKR